MEEKEKNLTVNNKNKQIKRKKLTINKQKEAHEINNKKVQQLTSNNWKTEKNFQRVNTQLQNMTEYWQPPNQATIISFYCLSISYTIDYE